MVASQVEKWTGHIFRCKSGDRGSSTSTFRPAFMLSTAGWMVHGIRTWYAEQILLPRHRLKCTSRKKAMRIYYYCWSIFYMVVSFLIVPHKNIIKSYRSNHHTTFEKYDVPKFKVIAQTKSILTYPLFLVFPIKSNKDIFM